jgi:CheY-like chemotaxis protein
MASRLKMAGHRCNKQIDGEQALKDVDLDSVDLLILDVMLPGMSGFELCRRVRSDAQSSGLPILFLSAMDSQEEIEHGLAQGADDYLTKPFSFPELVKRVGSLLAANGQDELIEPQTELPGPNATKLEIQSLINQNKGFGLVYVELLGLGELFRTSGATARAMALRHFARGLSICSEQLHADLFKAGHMGGGHFPCILHPAEVNSFSTNVSKVWNNHLPKLFAAIDEGQNVSEAKAAPRAETRGTALDIRICATTQDANSNMNFRELFEVLSNLRKSAAANGGIGIFIDRRT